MEISVSGRTCVDWIGGEVLGSPSAEQALADHQFQYQNYWRQDNFKKGGPARMEG